MVDFTKKATASIQQQIQDEARLAEPATYEVLSFFSSLELHADELSGQFIPVTSITPVRPDETQIFAIGVMPPSTNATGRLLDRAASVRTDPESFEETVKALREQGVNPDKVQRTTGDPETGIGGSGIIPIDDGRTIDDFPALQGDDKFWVAYVLMCNRLGVTPENLGKVIQTESGWNPAAVNGKSNAQGLIQLIRSTARNIGLTDDEWESFHERSRLEQLPTIERFYSRQRRDGSLRSRVKGKTSYEIKETTFGAYNNSEPQPGGSIYHSNAEELGLSRPGKQARGYAANITHDGPPRKGYITREDLQRKYNKRARITPEVREGLDRAYRTLGSPVESQPVTGDANSSTDFQRQGSANASESRKHLFKTANTILNQTDLGQAYQEAQKAEIAKMRNALQAIAELPPLRMLVNPASFRQSNEKVVAENWGRNGPVTEHWGDNQDKLEASGKIAAFYSLDAQAQADRTSGSVGNGPGLGRIARQFSKSYQNLLSLWLLYKNNGGVYFPDGQDATSGQNILSVVGSVYIYFDGILYIGSFDTFSLTESETAPFTLEYSYTFSVRAQFLLDHLDGQAFTYGAPALFTPRPESGRQTPVQSQEDKPLLGGSSSPVGAVVSDVESIVQNPFSTEGGG